MSSVFDRNRGAKSLKGGGLLYAGFDEENKMLVLGVSEDFGSEAVVSVDREEAERLHQELGKILQFEKWR